MRNCFLYLSFRIGKDLSRVLWKKKSSIFNFFTYFSISFYKIFKTPSEERIFLEKLSENEYSG